MKISILSGKLSGGGAERVACVLANKLSESTSVSIYRGDSSERTSFHISESINLSDLYFNYNTNGFFDNTVEFLKRLKVVRDKINVDKSDFVLGIKEDSSIRAALACIGTNSRVIACEHNNYYAMKNIFKRLFRNFVYYFLTHRIVLLTDDDIKNYPRYLINKISVIPNPLGINGYGISRSERKCYVRLLAVGRLTEQKGYYRMIDLISDLISSHIESFHLTIVGDGALRSDIEKYISEKQLTNYITIFPYTNDISTFYCESDILVMTSLWEGLPMVLGEAMSFGVVPIAYDCPTGPSVFINNEFNGFLVPDSDNKKFLQHLIELIEMVNNERFESFSLNARESSQRFSVENIINKWNEILLN
ncbi:glycosyltransferase family 4 protein [Shewanella baltica]|uniref:glycosyltransferase family 4 protein n=1 Tax=Shewanella baltica TaxID=62322 RepID=UPI003D79CC1D